MYDYVIVTHIPAFYKVNLYNALAKKLNIFVVFIANNTNEQRANDFITLEKADFKYKVLFDGNFQDRNTLQNINTLRQILKTINYKKILVSGWDLKEFWYLIFTNSKAKNCLALESTINESRIDGIRGLIKKIFLSRISKVFASGKLHVELLNALTYKGKIKVTKGVGIINKPNFEPTKREYRKRFLFVGRLSKVKNLEVLINLFNDLEGYTLTLIGVGEDEKYLRSIANENIIFLGAIENKDLKDNFRKNDVFILPSISEPWGLVVEEALHFRLPVIVSENCGSCELIKNDVNGYIIRPDDSKNIKNSILIINKNKFKQLLDEVENFSINKKDNMQVESYK